MTWDRFLSILKEQNWKCAICGIQIDEAGCLDHNHATGAVRGILCDDCNVGLGKFREDIRAIKSAANYIEQFREVQINS